MQLTNNAILLKQITCMYNRYHMNVVIKENMFLQYYCLKTNSPNVKQSCPLRTMLSELHTICCRVLISTHLSECIFCQFYTLLILIIYKRNMHK